MAPGAANMAMPTSSPDFNSENISGYDDYADLPGYI